MNPYNQSLSNQLEWVQAALDAVQALAPATRAKLVAHERELLARKRSLESLFNQPDKKGQIK